MRKSGLCEQWFAEADVTTRQVAGGANGHLFQTLLRASGYHDVACVDLLREGTLCHCAVLLFRHAPRPQIGQIYRNGVGTPTCPGNIKKQKELWNARAVHNQKMLSQLIEDEHATWLNDTTIADAALNRMSVPRRIEDYDIGELLLQPRFAVAQIRQDRSIKLRAVDHFGGVLREGTKTIASTCTQRYPKRCATKHWTHYPKPCGSSLR